MSRAEPHLALARDEGLGGEQRRLAVVGAGAGGLTAAAAAACKGWDVVLLNDGAEAMAGADAEVRVGNVEHLPYPDESFDTLLKHNGFSVYPDGRRALAMSPGGRAGAYEGKDVKQVHEWLGHADPGFTLRTYVHLLDEGLGDADFSAKPSPPTRLGSTPGQQKVRKQPRTPESARGSSRFRVRFRGSPSANIEKGPTTRTRSALSEGHALSRTRRVGHQLSDCS